MNPITELKENETNQEIYDEVENYLKSLGPVESMPHKTQVSFGGKGFATNFAFIWLNGKTLTLTFDLPRHVTDAPVDRTMFLRKDRWVHHIELKNKSDFSIAVKKLLKESFEFGKIGLKEWHKEHSK